MNSSEKLSCSYRSGVIYAIATTFSWAVIPILIKPAALELASANISFYRLLIGFIGLMFLSGLKKGWQQRALLSFKPACLAGILFAYHYWSYIEGISLSGPALGRVLVGLGSVFLAIMGVVLFKEELRGVQKLGIVLAFGGVAAFSYSLYGSGIGNVSLWAVLILISSALVWACYAGIQRNASRDSVGTEFLMIMFAVASLCTFLISHPSELFEVSYRASLSTLLLGLLTISGYFCFSKAIGQIPASHVSMFTCISPIITLLILLMIYTIFPSFLPPEGLSLISFLWAGFSVCGLVLVVTNRG